jgi:PTS system nitrogen regulatory IIA component
MIISEFLSARDVVVDFAAGDKGKVLQELGSRAAAVLELRAEPIVTGLLKREGLGSTGTGGGVAIPHARLEKVTRPVGVFARLKSPIEFDAIDGERVDLVFVLLLPTSQEGQYLQALAAVARALRDKDKLAKARRAKNASALYAAITE